MANDPNTPQPGEPPIEEGKEGGGDAQKEQNEAMAGNGKSPAIRDQIRDNIGHVFHEVETIGLEGGVDAKTFLLRIGDIAELVALEATKHNQQIKAFTKEDLERMIVEQHNLWMHQRKNPDINAQEKAKLDSKEKRIGFRRKAFNYLCEKTQLGLEKGDQINLAIERRDPNYIRKRLGRYWLVYNRICSDYDGGDVEQALMGITEAVRNEIPNSRLESFGERERVRARLAKRIESRLFKSTTKDLYRYDMRRIKMAEFLEESGDLALKSAAVGLLTVAGITPVTGAIAGGIWLARGFSESLGYDFGSVLEKAYEGSKQIGRRAWNFVRGKRTLPLPYRVPRTSPTKKQRLQLLWKSVFPLPALTDKLLKIPRKMWKKIPQLDKIVPDTNLRAGKLAADERGEVEKIIKEACRHALS